MKILAFETSCDDTSVAILENDRVVAMSTRTQLEHDATGGVVPEVAARSHANAIFPCLEDTLQEADISIDDIDYIACTREPGLQPSLLTGLTVARTLAESKKIPLLYIHHIESHIFANFLERNPDEIDFPAMVLTISGGHTELYLWKSLFDLELVGQTRDDAVGEAYDKVAKMLGLGFPGGAKIARLADAFRENPDFNQDEKNYWKKFFPRAFLDKNSYDFSFSGLKSAVKRYIDANPPASENDFQKIAFAFEEAVFDVLITKFLDASEHFGVRTMVLAGGVSANSQLKNRLEIACNFLHKKFVAPKKNIYSQDNAAMIGIRAFYEITKNPNFGNNPENFTKKL